MNTEVMSEELVNIEMKQCFDESKLVNWIS